MSKKTISVRVDEVEWYESVYGVIDVELEVECKPTKSTNS